jgi:hypothetical protein
MNLNKIKKFLRSCWSKYNKNFFYKKLI